MKQSKGGEGLWFSGFKGRFEVEVEGEDRYNRN